MIQALKKMYIAFIENTKRDFCGRFIYGLLLALSWLYGAAIALRNRLYDYHIIPSYAPRANVVSVGNISWGGSGKTPLCIWLYERLCGQWRTCVLRRGWGDDENKLLQEKVGNILYGKDRCALIKKNQQRFDLFILDDGFQYRRLRRSLDIVIMSSREFLKPQRLLPAYFFREPLNSLSRADIVIVNHSDEAPDRDAIKARIKAVANGCEVYFARYIRNRFVDFDGIEYRLDYFLSKPIAAFAAIGYPGGFFRKLRESGLWLKREIVYPDHYVLRQQELARLEAQLLSEGITTLLITHKDKFHFPYRPRKLAAFIMEVGLVVDNEEGLLSTISERLGKR